MAEASAFRYFDDPVARTGASEIFVALTGTFTGPGLLSVPFEVAPLLAQAIRDLAGQDTTDGIAETTKAIYLASGALWGSVSCWVTAGAPAVVSTVTVGGVAYGLTKALDLADGLEQFVG